MIPHASSRAQGHGLGGRAEPDQACSALTLWTLDKSDLSWLICLPR